jgi:hypothetical protein
MSNVVTDIVGRTINIGDFVYFYGSMYEVKKTFAVANTGYGRLKLMIYPASKTSKNKDASGRDCCLIPKEDIVIWMLKRENK